MITRRFSSMVWETELSGNYGIMEKDKELGLGEEYTVSDEFYRVIKGGVRL